MIGERIKNILQEKEISVSEVAAKLKLTPQSLYKMFKKSSIESKYIEELANILGVSVLDFFGEERSRIAFAKRFQYSAGLLMQGYTNRLVELKSDPYWEATKQKEVKRTQYLLKESLNLAQIETFFSYLDELESFIKGSDAISARIILESVVGKKLHRPISKTMLQDMINNDLIENDTIKNYLLEIVED